MTQHIVLTTDGRNMEQVQDGSINLIVTSPPYPMIEMWDDIFSKQNPDIRNDLMSGDGMGAFNKMHDILDAVWHECDRVLAPNGFVCINIGDATRTVDGNFQLFSNHYRIIDFFMKHGYCVMPDILWRKQSNSPNKFMGSGMYPAGAYVTYEHEYILIFRKGGKRIFKGQEKLLRQKSAYFWEERNVWFSDLWDIKGTSQTIRNNDATRKRNASFPFEIPYRLVNMYSAEGDTVLDPFCGLGTTNLACIASKRNSIGLDIDAELSKMAISELVNSVERINSVIRGRLAAHLSFIDSLSEEKKEKCYTNRNHAFLVKTRQEIDIHIQDISHLSAENNQIFCKYC
jgi:DNA modification methylase